MVSLLVLLILCWRLVDVGVATVVQLVGVCLLVAGLTVLFGAAALAVSGAVLVLVGGVGKVVSGEGG